MTKNRPAKRSAELAARGPVRKLTFLRRAYWSRKRVSDGGPPCRVRKLTSLSAALYIEGTDEVMYDRSGHKHGMPWFCIDSSEQVGLAFCIFVALAAEDAKRRRGSASPRS
ncbi:hypothetical protein [Burkholderia ubonensis]|uniref:hypothetical protein n=1 Tax=Burkholderia ubonensis TaxID=101571 RepID=UPI0012F99117|nr:hypothetical protein [Burkholderia ubonensis]